MKLSEKGRYVPPPSLPKHAQAVLEVLAGWPDVHARTHWLLGDEQELLDRACAMSAGLLSAT